MMHAIQLGRANPSHQFKFCAKCQTDKPPEGGIDMGAKWHCQNCWNKRSTSNNLKQNRATPKTTRAS
jgi:hypothetical protein